ncbi:ATP-binding protein [Streptomyces sp. NRRL S-920]|uniref:ATP-binding protein n=1 Tax=Streptomyces sp. NRRL S-920 TaxID=1463921 RepID=UPI000B26D602|nr:ATP-binding protein [Streptomyces sp. NRRL S-920]
MTHEMPNRSAETPAREVGADGATQPNVQPEPHQYAFDGDDQAPARARHHVREALCSWRMPENTVDTAVLLASEITTNAVRHTTSSSIQLELLRRDGEVEVAVRDSGPRPARPLRAISEETADLWDEHGRGLDLVRRLSSRWGATEAGPGLRVWAAIEATGDVR